MIPSTLFAFVVALSSVVAVNGGVIQRDGSFTYVTPQPTASLQLSSGTSSIPSSSPSSGVTSSPIPTSSGTRTSASSTPSQSGGLPPPTTSGTTSTPVTSGSPTSGVPVTSSGAPVTSPSISGSVPVVPSVPTTSGSAPATGGSIPATIKTSPTVTPTTSPSAPATVKTSAAVSSTSSAPAPAGTANCNGVQQWQADFAYTAGNKVIFNSALFTALQWTYDNSPPAHADQWAPNGVCSQPINNQANCNGVAAWSSLVAYTTGSQVTFNGHLWSAVQWTQSNTPGDTSGSWKDLGACA